MSGRNISPNLALDQRIAERRARGERIVHLGFGESRLPVFPPLREALVEGAERNAYGPVAGAEDVRTAVAGWFGRRALPTTPDQVIVAPGSKALLLALQLVHPGDVLLPSPCWVTYRPQAVLAGKRALGVPVPAECGGVPDPDALRARIRRARAQGQRPGILILTSPDNPTGTTAAPALIRELCGIAEEEELLVVSDEIYRDLLHDPRRPYLSPAEVLPHRTVVVTGLSKNLALGGWRIGAARFPADEDGRRLRDDVASVASENWSTLAGPMQQVAAYAFAEPPELRARLAADARLHARVAAAVYERFVAVGAVCRPPTGGFYVYPDFEPLRAVLARQGVSDDEGLQRLLEDHGVAVLAGRHFGDDPAALRFRAATSMLYGDTREEQRASQQAVERGEDPLLLPHVAEVLGDLERALAKLTAV